MVICGRTVHASLQYDITVNNYIITIKNNYENSCFKLRQ